MDHTDGKEWEVEVWNHLVNPKPPNDEIDHQCVARYYEQRNRGLMTVVHMGKMKDDDLTGIEPHDRMFHRRRSAVRRTSCQSPVNR
jgi:hypothetical protein